MMSDEQRGRAALYALLCRMRGDPPEIAAQRTVRRYPAIRSQMEREGLLAPPEARERRWDDDQLASRMENRCPPNQENPISSFRASAERPYNPTNGRPAASAADGSSPSNGASLPRVRPWIQPKEN